MWNQGQSGVLNEKILANDRMFCVSRDMGKKLVSANPGPVPASWLDHSRDLMHLINLKRDEMPNPLVGIGHSMGGAQL